MLQEFPDIDSLYKSRTLARLVAREQFDIAATFVGQDPGLQVGVGRSSRLVSSPAAAGRAHQRGCGQACSLCRLALSLPMSQRLCRRGLAHVLIACYTMSAAARAPLFTSAAHLSSPLLHASSAGVSTVAKQSPPEQHMCWCSSAPAVSTHVHSAPALSINIHSAPVVSICIYLGIFITWACSSSIDASPAWAALFLGTTSSAQAAPQLRTVDTASAQIALHMPCRSLSSRRWWWLARW